MMPSRSIIYALPYLLLVGYCILVFFLEQSFRKKKLSIANPDKFIRTSLMCVFVVFFGLRGFIGWDWFSYYPMFEKIEPLFSGYSNDETLRIIEPGFMLYVSCLKFLGINYEMFILLSTVIDFLIINIFLKKYSLNYALSCITFLVMGGFYLETDLLRNAKGIMLFLLSIPYLKERKILPYMALNVLGIFFHFSSIFFLPLYFFLHKTFPRKFIIIIVALGMLLFFLQIEYIKPIILSIAGFFGGKLSYAVNLYLNSDVYSSPYGISIGLIERLITAFLIIIYYEKILAQSTYNIIFVNSFVLFYIFFFYLAEINVFSTRIGGLFYYSYWIMIPAIYYAITLRNNKALFLCYFFLFALFKMNGMTNTIIYRYNNQLFAPESYEVRKSIADTYRDELQ